jgi:glycosyltransferase involved in cell wall biosynthesis
LSLYLQIPSENYIGDMKLIILTQYYPPEHGAPQNRLHDLAKRFVSSGHKVTVMTAMPNYPKGKIFPEYRGWFTKRDELDGVKIIRSWIFASKAKGKIPQLMVYFSFVFSAIFAGIFRLPRADYLICESPPLFLGFTALILKFFKGSKLVMNISDLWPESAVQLGMIGPGIALSVLEWFEKLLYKKSSIVLCQTEGIVDGVKKASPKTEAHLFPNGVDLEMFTPGTKDAKLAKEFGIEDAEFIVGYGGNHGRSQALSQVLEAADIVQKKNDKIKVLLCGDGPEKDELIVKAEKMKLENLKFIDSQPREKMCEIQALWDIALVPLKNIELFDGARPSKMFELMAGEIPFIFCGKGEGAEVAEDSGCARIVPPEDSAKLAETILELAKLAKSRRDEMGQKGRKFVEGNFNRAKLAEELMKKLETV